MILNAFSRLPKYWLIPVIPALADFAAFIIGMLAFGFSGERKISLKLSLDVGLPTAGTIADQPQAIIWSVGGGHAAGLSGLALLFLLVFFVLHAFCQGGYIGLLKDCARQRSVSMQRFLEYGFTFFSRYLRLEIAVFAVGFLAMLVLVGIFRFLGALIFAVVFIIWRILYLYWEFTLAVDDLSVRTSFVRCREYFRKDAATAWGIAVVMLLVNALFALFLNALWHPVTYILIVILYSFTASVLQLSLMMALLKVRS